MALIICPDCNKQVSDAAPACPHCGRPARSAEARKEIFIKGKRLKLPKSGPAVSAKPGRCSCGGGLVTKEKKKTGCVAAVFALFVLLVGVWCVIAVNMIFGGILILIAFAVIALGQSKQTVVVCSNCG